MSDQNGQPQNGNGHDQNGHFAPGNKQGRGRPRRDGKRYQAILQKALTPQKFRAIVDRIINDAITEEPKFAHHAWNWIGKFGGLEPVKTLELLHRHGEEQAEREREAAQKLFGDPARMGELLDALDKRQNAIPPPAPNGNGGNGNGH